MAAAFRTLRDDSIKAGLLAGNCMFHRAADIHHLHAGLVQLFENIGRHAETGNEGRGTFLDHDVGRAFERFGHGGEQVHTERLVGQVLHLLHLYPDFFRLEPRHAECSEAACVGNGGCKLRIGNATHAGQHDRIFDAENVAKRCADRHD